jgi:hypothetical protein
MVYTLQKGDTHNNTSVGEVFAKTLKKHTMFLFNFLHCDFFKKIKYIDGKNVLMNDREKTDQGIFQDGLNFFGNCTDPLASSPSLC